MTLSGPSKLQKSIWPSKCDKLFRLSDFNRPKIVHKICSVLNKLQINNLQGKIVSSAIPMTPFCQRREPVKHSRLRQPTTVFELGLLLFFVYTYLNNVLAFCWICIKNLNNCVVMYDLLQYY